jgi:hypothetical protein
VHGLAPAHAFAVGEHDVDPVGGDDVVPAPPAIDAIDLDQGIVYELEGGLIIRMRNYLDPADALEAAGLSE